MDVGDIYRASKEFKEYLDGIKKELAPNNSLEPLHPHGFYPYDTLHVVQRMNDLLLGEYRDIGKLAGDKPVLDIGCGDGDLAYLLEVLGFNVHAVDIPKKNFNGMHGAKLLHEKLNSRVNLIEMDIDKSYGYPSMYDLVFMFGVLYHLKNPYRMLEELAGITKYLIMSTTIIRYNKKGHGAIDMKELPVAYLADYKEINDDPSNTWVFTEKGLERITRLAGWRYINYKTFGATKSYPSVEGDQRAFILMERDAERI